MSLDPAGTTPGCGTAGVGCSRLRDDAGRHQVYSAVQRKSVRFHQLSGKTGVRIPQKRVDPPTGDEVPYEEIVKGYEIAPDQYVLIEPAELEALDPKKTKTIEI